MCLGGRSSWLGSLGLGVRVTRVSVSRVRVSRVSVSGVKVSRVKVIRYSVCVFLCWLLHITIDRWTSCLAHRSEVKMK